MADIQKRQTNKGVRWDVRYRNDGNRQRKRNFARKVDAQHFANSVETDLLRGDWIDPRRGQELFGKWTGKWLTTNNLDSQVCGISSSVFTSRPRSSRSYLRHGLNAMEHDVDGAAAPPRSNGELSFEHLWQGRLFATTIAACDAGLIDYPEFRNHLIAAIARRDRESNDPSEYWSTWQDALEDLMLGVGVIQSGEINRRAGEFAQHSAHGD